MTINNREYQKYVQKKSPRSPLGKDLCWAFVVGGLICTIGQFFLDLYQSWGMERTDASGAVSITLILAAAILTGVGVFDNIARQAGAGTLVPITGFANAMVSPALEFRSEGLVTGTAVKLFTVAGPVLVFGISASVLYGIVLLLAKIL